MFYFGQDGDWLLGTFNGTSLSFNRACNTAVKAGNTWQFGNISAPPPAHQFWVGAFDATGLDNILFYNPPDSHWWLGTFNGNQLSWHFVGNTAGFGNISELQFWIGDFGTFGQDNVLFYYPGDGNWWLGTLNRSESASQLNWARTSNTGTSLTSYSLTIIP
jgi:hypothetical protein